MFEQDRQRFRQELDGIREQGLWKEERILQSAQGAKIRVNGKEVLCLCANNYLGLANDESLRTAAKHAIDTHGLGLASVRFICGTQDLHKTLEQRVSADAMHTARLAPNAADLDAERFIRLSITPDFQRDEFC